MEKSGSGQIVSTTALRLFTEVDRVPHMILQLARVYLCEL